MHNLVLGCLLDLSENAKAIPHINAWRGNGDISAAHLLCDIWRQEEHDMSVNRESNGAIKGKIISIFKSSIVNYKLARSHTEMFQRKQCFSFVNQHLFLQMNSLRKSCSLNNTKDLLRVHGDEKKALSLENHSV